MVGRTTFECPQIHNDHYICTSINRGEEIQISSLNRRGGLGPLKKFGNDHRVRALSELKFHFYPFAS